MKILIVSIQRIGDVLLSTPLIKSIKSAYPNAIIDVLICTDTCQVLEGNDDINSVIAVQRKSKNIARITELYKLWNRYDLSISTMPSDRARIYAWAAAKMHYGTCTETDSFLFKWLMDKRVLFDNHALHTVEMNLKICDMLGISKKTEVTIPKTNLNKFPIKLELPFVVIHPYPKFVYKSWSILEWRELINFMTGKGLRVIISGGSDEKEIEYCQELVISDRVENLAGKLSLAEVSEMISKAHLYIGVDTSVTHLAAATGVKVFAIYGPTNPVKWGPWPYTKETIHQPIWISHSPTPQVNSNITLIQGGQNCIPCAEEGCERHINSKSECLTMLKSETVIKEVSLFLRDSVVGDSF